MEPINFRRIAAAGFAAAILLAVPVAKAGTVDLGVVAYEVQVNAGFPHIGAGNSTYVYDQLLFTGPLSMTFDGGMTLAEVLADLNGPVNVGTLTYNFPLFGFFPFYASGSYTQNGLSAPVGSADPGTVSLTAQTASGNPCPGASTVGSTINLDPIYSALVFATILGCDGFTATSESAADMTETTPLPPLGTITNGGTITNYIGEITTTVWQPSGAIGLPSSVPEPSTLWLGAAGIAALCTIRVRRRFRKPRE